MSNCVQSLKCTECASDLLIMKIIVSYETPAVEGMADQRRYESMKQNMIAFVCV